MEIGMLKKDYTENRLPRAWGNAAKAEEKAEVLLYGLMALCMESFSDVEIELEAGNSVGAVIKSWARNEFLGLGTNAITLDEDSDGKLLLSCTYDIWKLREDVDVFNEMFGSLDLAVVGEGALSEEHDISKEEIESLLGGIQKVKTPLNK